MNQIFGEWRMRAALVGFLVIVLGVLLLGRAQAHSFNVALVIPLSGSAQADGKAIRDGFLLATRERDGHPNEESDGHLGGLDVYVDTTDIHDSELAGLKSLLQQKPIDIIVPIGSERPIDAALLSIADADTILLAPGRLPFPADSQLTGTDQSPEVMAFVAAFTRDYGYRPSVSAARGYNAARRIDAAVRAQAGVADKAALLASLRQTASGFDW